ncbi:MAG: MMPL family transporter [Myxococcota bacterium]
MSAVAPPRPSRLDRWLRATTLAAHRHPWRVLAVTVVVLAVAWGTASRLRVRGSFVELLPSESPTAQRFRATLDRKGGAGSTILVMVASPDAKANRALVDALEAELRTLPDGAAKSIEHGPGPSRVFFERWRWLFAERRDLMVIACEVRRERLRRLGQYLDLDDPCADEVDDELARGGFPTPREQARRGRSGGPEDGEEPGAQDASEGAQLSPLTRLKRTLERKTRDLDRFPSGYFQSEDGQIFAIVVRSFGAGMGELKSDQLLAAVRERAARVDARAFHPDAEVGFGGDIPNAVAQREALVEDMTVVSVVAVTLILGVIVLFFRSGWPLLHILLSVGTGTGLAFAAAAIRVGYLNAATSFLGSIIVGNGINDSIVYLGRYRERRAGGDDVPSALVEAATSTRRGTWLASVAASGAYGALMITSFRGFSEFGLIGAVGMVSCWFATYGVCPASVTVVERFRARRPEGRRGGIKPMRHRVVRAIAGLSVRYPVPVLLATATLAVAAAWPLPSYLRDPWEYDFSKLGSRSNRQTGAGVWSAKANDIFQSRGAPDLMLAADITDALPLAYAVVDRDAAVTGGTFVARVDTIHDRLGGPPEEVARKLEVLDEIRTELDAVGDRLRGEDAEFAERWRPPEYLRPVTPDDLPVLVRDQYTEEDGAVGTPVYVYFDRKLSRSKGENLLKMADVLESVTGPDGAIAPNASRATVFAEMIRSMERDGPRATWAAFMVVVVVSLLATRRLAAAVAVVGSLLSGVLFTVGGAAWLGVRLNFLNFVALPLTFGIGVEYAINLYDRIRVSGGDIVRGMGSAGSAVALCSLTTIFGYGSLLWADNLALRSFGTYAVAGELACILTGLVVLPAALTLRRRRRA